MVLPVMGYGRARMGINYYKVRQVAGKALKRFDLNVDMGKDRLWQVLHDKEKSPGPGYMHLPADLPDSYYRQLASEMMVARRQRTGREVWSWILKEGFRENHLLDGNIYCDLAAEISGVFSLADVDYVQEFNQAGKKRSSSKGRSDDFWASTPDINI